MTTTGNHGLLAQFQPNVRKKTQGLYRSTRAWLSTGIAEAALPESVRSAIREQQDSSERLIGWIQIAILMVFAILYFAGPKAYPENTGFRPVPIFLSFYFVFTCIRLYFAYKTSLASWMLVLSVVVDMALLIGLIWSFHIQYMQPTSFSLKAPTLLYIFIFISLRALRFGPGYVLLAGFVGAMGWLLLVWLAVEEGNGATVITRDYVLHLTSNKILIGAEVDKVISIMLVSIILTLAIARGRRLLVSSIVEATTARNLSHFVPKSIATQIKNAAGPLIDTQAETKEASILFVDLVSFTSLAEQLPPEKLIVTLNEYFSLISGPIERNHGVINQFQGDAILASFNLPTPDENHASSAIAAALEITEILANHTFNKGSKLSIRAGINTGTVVGGFFGTLNRLNYTVYGDDVNIAARLQGLCKQLETTNLVSQRTMELSNRELFEFTSKGNELLRGRKSEVRVFEASFRINRSVS